MLILVLTHSFPCYKQLTHESRFILSYPFISLSFSFGCASTFFISAVLLKLARKGLVYDSSLSLFFISFLLFLLLKADIVSFEAFPLPFCKPLLFSGIFCQLHPFRSYPLLMLLYPPGALYLRAGAFCPAFIILPAPALMISLAG